MKWITEKIFSLIHFEFLESLFIFPKLTTHTQTCSSNSNKAAPKFRGEWDRNLEFLKLAFVFLSFFRLKNSLISSKWKFSQRFSYGNFFHEFHEDSVRVLFLRVFEVNNRPEDNDGERFVMWLGKKLNLNCWSMQSSGKTGSSRERKFHLILRLDAASGLPERDE